MNMKDEQIEQLELILKGNKKAVFDFYTYYKTQHFVKEITTFSEKYIDLHDLFQVDLSSLDDDTLIKLHQFTNWHAPSYFLRRKYFHAINTASDAVLFILVQAKSEKAREELMTRYLSNIEEASDEVLVLMCQDSVPNAMDVLITRYNPFVKKTINRLQRKYFFRGFELDDLIQEGVLGLFKAIDDFKIERKTRFRDFSKHVIEKHIGTLILRSSNYKNKVLNESFSYHTPIGGDSEITFEQLLKGGANSPEAVVENTQIFYEIAEKFTNLEKIVLVHYELGLSYEEIGKRVGKNKKAIDNTIQRIRTKGRTYLEMNHGIKKFTI